MNWLKDLFKSKFLETLAGKLTAILAFAIILVVILAIFGSQIEDRWLPLVYIVAIAAMGIFTYEVFAQNKPQSREQLEKEKPQENSIEPQRDIPPDIETQDSQRDVSPPEAKSRYLNELVLEYTPLSLSVLDVHSGDIKGRLALEEIYISLNTTTQIEKDDSRRGRVREKSKEDEVLAQLGRESEPLAVLDAMEKTSDRRMVLLGKPGTGKSTFVRYLALRMAQLLVDPKANPLEGWSEQPLLPVAISLGRFAEEIPLDTKCGTAKMLEAFIQSTLERNDQMKDFAPLILDYLRKEGGLFLFDGLDEVANLDLRPIVVQAVESFVSTYKGHPKSRFLVTCRTYSYEDERWKLTNWPVHELALLAPWQIDWFIDTWYKLHGKLEPKRQKEFEGKRSKLLSAVQPGDPRRLYEIAPFPIILTVMAIVHAAHELPDSRALVYERCVEILLEKWQLARSIQGSEETRSILAEMDVSASQIYSALYEIAYEAHKGFEKEDKRDDASTSLITEGLVVQVLHDQIGDRTKEDIFLEYCQKANGLLMLRGTIIPPGTTKPRRYYTLPHLTFEEYLASRCLKGKDTEHARELFNDGEDRWRETIKFMAEFLCFSNDPNRDKMNGLLEAFSFTTLDNPSALDWRALWLAGELLAYYRRRFSSKPSVHEPAIVKNLHRLIHDSPLSIRDRAEAADVLDQIWEPEDLFKFLPIPGTPTPNLHMGKYPITNLQYERFLKSDFGNKKYWVDFPKFDENSQPMNETWGEEGWKWLQKELQDKDYDIQEGVLLPRYWRDPRFGVSRRNAPVVGISWYEASAYCRWLLENWDTLEEGKQGLSKPQLVRLPIDTEWTSAAGGEDPKERYAWDKKGTVTKTEDIVRYANTAESGINRTTPVWMYPQGESSYHVMDMSGNVWEWQTNYSGEEYGGQKALSNYLKTSKIGMI
ncbi:MAG: SUMF1/EgtB/PvdO family nonheme iron enzyme [Anaerolineales bacterium]|nr:SUMF1/EgtB/PvdO family nonheme iron enzyme [Anaerolineales bacterium]